MEEQEKFNSDEKYQEKQSENQLENYQQGKNIQIKENNIKYQEYSPDQDLQLIVNQNVQQEENMKNKSQQNELNNEFLELEEQAQIKLNSEDEKEAIEIQNDIEDLFPPKSDSTLDNRVINFILLLEDYRMQFEQQYNYDEAKKIEMKIQLLHKREIQRQQLAMKNLQQQELQNVENAQKFQYQELSVAWDKIMNEYEEAATETIQKLKEKQYQEIINMKEKINNETPFKASSKLLDIRKRESTLLKMRQYEASYKLKIKADQMQEDELIAHKYAVQDKLNIVCEAIHKRQKQQLQGTIARIQRDRMEQMNHRMQDQQRFLQRSKNIRKNLETKYVQEQKKEITNLQREISIKTVQLKQRNRTNRALK